MEPWPATVEQTGCLWNTDMLQLRFSHVCICTIKPNEEKHRKKRCTGKKATNSPVMRSLWWWRCAFFAGRFIWRSLLLGPKSNFHSALRKVEGKLLTLFFNFSFHCSYHMTPGLSHTYLWPMFPCRLTRRAFASHETGLNAKALCSPPPQARDSCHLSEVHFDPCATFLHVCCMKLDVLTRIAA